MLQRLKISFQLKLKLFLLLSFLLFYFEIFSSSKKIKRMHKADEFRNKLKMYLKNKNREKFLLSYFLIKTIKYWLSRYFISTLIKYPQFSKLG